MKLVIIGGIAGGATAAARARRLSEAAEIVLIERGPDISFANCGLPYHIGGEIKFRSKLLVQTVTGLGTRYRLDIRTRHEAARIDRAAKIVTVRNLETHQEYSESYDFLLLSPGAAPLRPRLEGIDSPHVFVLRNMQDMDQIKARVDSGAKSAVIVGGGYVGLELAENFRRRNLDVTLIELQPQLMPPLDPEMAVQIKETLEANGIRVILKDAVNGFSPSGEGLIVNTRSDLRLSCDFAVLSIGVTPESELAKHSGLSCSERGAIMVDEQMRTSDPSIYAVGDAVQVEDPVLGGPAFIPLAGPANRQARIAIDAMFGRASRYRGTLGTAVLRVFDRVVALTGASEKVLKQRSVPYRKVYVIRGQHVSYFPGAQPMLIKLVFTPDSGRVLGAQIVGGEGVDKRIDVIATAIYAGLKVHDLEHLELAYAPQFGSAKDPINIAANVATNLLSGDEDFVYAEDLDPASWTVLDVSEPSEFEAGHVPGAINIPLGSLRSRLGEVPVDKPLAVYCAIGQRAYYATRILRAHGLKPRNIAGGLTLWRLVKASAEACSASPALLEQPD